MQHRNPTFPWDVPPPAGPQLRLTGTSQTGRLVLIDNPISYVVEPGRYYPFLSLRGHTDPVSRDLTDRLVLGEQVGEQIPDNREPHYGTPDAYVRSKAVLSTRGAVPNTRRPMANTTLGGIGPLGGGQPAPGPDNQWFLGLPNSGEIGGV